MRLRYFVVLRATGNNPDLAVRYRNRSLQLDRTRTALRSTNILRLLSRLSREVRCNKGTVVVDVSHPYLIVHASVLNVKTFLQSLQLFIQVPDRNVFEHISYNTTRHNGSTDTRTSVPSFVHIGIPCFRATHDRTAFAF